MATFESPLTHARQAQRLRCLDRLINGAEDLLNFAKVQRDSPMTTEFHCLFEAHLCRMRLLCLENTLLEGAPDNLPELLQSAGVLRFNVPEAPATPQAVVDGATPQALMDGTEVAEPPPPPLRQAGRKRRRCDEDHVEASALYGVHLHTPDLQGSEEQHNNDLYEQLQKQDSAMLEGEAVDSLELLGSTGQGHIMTTPETAHGERCDDWIFWNTSSSCEDLVNMQQTANNNSQ